MNFDLVANQIVSKAIRSAICIDDEYVGPYEDVKKAKWDESRKLWESFRKNNCSLDIYSYKGYPEEKQFEFIFNNRDLLILDWELTNDPIKYKDTLEILKIAAKNPGLAFVVIYTIEEDLDNIEMQIRSYFNQKIRNREEGEETFIKFLLSLEENSEREKIPLIIAEEFFKEKTIKDALEKFFMSGPSDKAREDFRGTIRDNFQNEAIGKKFTKIFEEKIKEHYLSNTLYEACEQLEFYYKNTFSDGSISEMYCHKIYDQSHALQINNTHVVIFNKKKFEPEFVYDKFSKSICSKPGNIMTLIALEMKNNFRENSVRIGKDLLAIDELAFFHHWFSLNEKKNENEEKFLNEEFYDFLRNNWKHQVASFHLDFNSEVFQVMDEYIDNNKIDEKVAKRKNEGFEEETHRVELAKLNFQYSFHHSKRKEKDYLRFGDIFNIRDSEEATETEKFLLNITAHCDCLRPEKIENRFYFVSGEKAGLENALDKANNEDNCFSFFWSKVNQIPICISWHTKPFTIYISKEKRFFYPKRSIKVKIGEDDKYLFYTGALLENYAQKITNKSFANAARVGVDLVDWRKPKKKSKK
ncbi:MAG: response regulator receiver domain [Candidatus Omnitrophota bacterium]